MKTAPLAIIYFLVASMLGAVGQFLYKTGADRAHGVIQTYILNSRIVLGACCYVAVMVLFVAAFKQKASPSALYPLYATTFIWAALLDHVLYGRIISPTNVAGMILLVVGMYLLGKTS
jgi:drug/metabolite transporter (DMT)-like permease